MLLTAVRMPCTVVVIACRDSLALDELTYIARRRQTPPNRMELQLVQGPANALLSAWPGLILVLIA